MVIVPAIGCGYEHPDNPRNEQFEISDILPEAVSERASRHFAPDCTSEEFVQNLARKPTQMGDTQGGQYVRIHDRILDTRRARRTSK
jgi:hypothetical protein